MRPGRWKPLAGRRLAALCPRPSCKQDEKEPPQSFEYTFSRWSLPIEDIWEERPQELCEGWRASCWLWEPGAPEEMCARARRLLHRELQLRPTAKGPRTHLGAFRNARRNLCNPRPWTGANGDC